MRQDNIQLVREHNHVKQACEELRRLHNDDQREVADMRMLQKQVPVESICLAFWLSQHCSTGQSILLQTAPKIHYVELHIWNRSRWLSFSVALPHRDISLSLSIKKVSHQTNSLTSGLDRVLKGQNMKCLWFITEEFLTKQFDGDNVYRIVRAHIILR